MYTKQICIFCLLLFGGAAASLLAPDRQYSDTENRMLAEKPALSREDILSGEYQKAYETYLNDQYPFREKWISLSSDIQLLLQKKEINGVYLGKDGYLLEKEDDVPDEEQAAENVEILSGFLNEMTEEYGKEHVTCLMVPSKAEALPQKLPAYAEPESRQELLEDLRDKLTEPSVLLDVSDSLKRHQKEYIYYRTDHHWTTLGAFYAYTEWLGLKKSQGNAVKPPKLQEYQREKVFDDFYGTTYNKAHVKVKADEVEIFQRLPGSEIKKTDGIQVLFDDEKKPSDSLYFKEEAEKGFNRYNVFLAKNTFKIVISTKAGTGKKLLLVKDSFANCFVPFLTEEYDQIVMIDYRYGKEPVGKVLDQYGFSDILVLFNTEKFMENTKLQKLADTKRESTMEEFDLEEFLK